MTNHERTKATKNTTGLLCNVPVVIFVLFVASPASAQERVAEILVHGNHTTPSGDVLAIAGLAVGEPATPARLAEAERALRDSGRFAGVEIRKRFRSLASTSDVLIVILVDEHAAVSAGDLTPGPLRRARAAAMWMPILGYADGYGLTYGARAAIVDALGPGTRISAPLTWGGEQKAGLEVELPAAAGSHRPGVRAGVAATRRVNPHFDTADTRQQITVAADLKAGRYGRWLRAGVTGRLGHVSFAAEDAWHRAGGVQLTVDTRLDPSFPRNAVHAELGWERIGFGGGSAARSSLDARGYAGIGGSAVLALRAAAIRAHGSLPPSEQVLIGGAGSLRGYRAGHRAGDGLALLSLEARVPLTSALSLGRFGVTAFVDAAAPWAAGAPLARQRFDRGIGGGVYFGATLFTASVDVAWPRDGKPRVHASAGVTF